LLGIVGGAVLAIFIVALVAVSLFFDPNDYKVEISTAVEQATGRQLSLDGDLELDIFPRLRVAIGAAELSNAAAFGDAPFATIQGAGLAVGLLPLLSRRVEIGEARLEGLVLNLARNEQGQNNWQELGGTAAPESASSTADSAGLELDVGAIIIADAETNWSDAAAGSDWQFGDFNMNAEGLGPAAAFPLSVDLSLSGDEVQMEVSASGALENSVMTNRDLTADLEFMTVTGGGTVNIVTDAIDFDVIARFVDGTVLQSDTEIVDFAGDELPLTISGSLSSPSVLLDFSAMLRAEAEEALQEEIEEEREELQDRLEDRLRGLFDR